MGKYTIPVFAATGASGILMGVFCWLYGTFSAGWMLSCAITFGTTFYHFAMRLMVGYVIRRGPDPGCGWFRQRNWEPKLYVAFRVKHWKKRMPTFCPEQFSLKENTTQQVIQNCCRAEIIHEVIAVLSFLPVLTIPYFGAGGRILGNIHGKRPV